MKSAPVSTSLPEGEYRSRSSSVGKIISRTARQKFIAAALFSAAVIFLFSAAPAVLAGNGTGEIGNVCVGQFVNPANCTANDVLFEEFSIVEVVESCTTGTPGEAEVIFDAVVRSNSPNRYGIGLFINLDGESAITGSNCLHDFLSPFSSNPGDWNQVPVNDGNNLAFAEPFPELNGDQCGDIPGNSRIIKQLQQVRIPCNDLNGNGFVDINACASWENNRNAQCGGLGDAVPGTPSKCGCTDVDTDLAMPATLTIRKFTTDGDDTFDFVTTSNPELDQTFSLPANFSITTTGGEGSEDFDGFVEPGVYTIDEDVPDGWRLDSATCSNGHDPQAAGGGVTLGPGDNVTCTFTNSPIVPGSVTIIKNAVGGDGSFEFTGNLGGFTIATSSGTGSETFSNVTPGSYDVTETVPSGWGLAGISCSNAESSVDVSAATASIVVGEDESVSCTFTNTADGTLVIEKATVPSGSDQQFAFSGSVQGEIGDGGQLSVTGQPGTFTAAETVPAGWTLTDIQCSGANNSVVTKDETGVSVDLAAGETVTCVFTNIQRASLTIVKDATGGDDVFEFTSGSLPDAAFSIDTSVGNSITFSDLEPATYDVTELGPPEGWILLNAFCDTGNGNNGDLWSFIEQDQQIVVQLKPGADVTCTFSNGLLGSVSITKIAIGGDAVFSFVGDDPIGEFSINTATGSATADFTDILEPGTYTITETPVPEGWALTDIQCALDTSRTSEVDLEAGSATITVEFGETYNCTFTNTADGTLVIEKTTVPSGSDQLFAFSGSVEGEISDGGQLSVSGQPGIFTAAESVPDGWSLTDIQCAGAINSVVTKGEADVSVDLAAGETVTCTFVNEQDDEPELTLDFLAGVCVQDAPYADYEITATGSGEDEPTLTVRWIIIEDGSNVVAETLTNQPLSGQLLWPGAEVDADGNGIAWPGWVFVPGEGFVEVPTNLRPDMLIEFEAGSSLVSGIVTYPPGSPTCDANPGGEPEIPEPFPVPVNSRLGLALMALMLMGLAGLVIRRRQRVARG